MSEDKKPNKEKAVALGYDRGISTAPKVLAKGQGEIAKQILKVAGEHGIPIQQDADLVELLSVVELDAFIPVEAYVAVAEILAYIYRKNGELKSDGRPVTPTGSAPAGGSSSR